MGDSSYWTGEPAVGGPGRGAFVLYPNPQMSSHGSVVAKKINLQCSPKTLVLDISFYVNPREDRRSG